MYSYFGLFLANFDYFGLIFGREHQKCTFSDPLGLIRTMEPKKWVHLIIWKIGFPRCPRTHPGPKDTLKWPREGQNWRQCTSCGPTNWFRTKKTKFESVTSNLCSFHSESALRRTCQRPATLFIAQKRIKGPKMALKCTKIMLISF